MSEFLSFVFSAVMIFCAFSAGELYHKHECFDQATYWLAAACLNAIFSVGYSIAAKLERMEEKK